MRFRTFVLLPVMLAAALVACKTERTVISQRKEMDPVLKKFASNFEVVTDDKGNTSVKSDARSQFESKMFREGKAEARTQKDFKTKDFAGLKDFKTNDFKGLKDFKTTESRYNGQASRYDEQWSGADKTARESDKTFATKDYATKTFRDNEKTYPTRVAPEVRGDNRYHDPALENIRPNRPGEGGNPTVKDIRDLIGKGP